MRSNKLILGVLVGVGLLAAYWVLLLSPKRAEVTALETDVAQQQQEVSASQAKLSSYRAARDNYKGTYLLVTRLGKAVPADDDVRSLVVQLDAAAKRNKVDFRSIQLTTAGDGTASLQPADATTVSPPPGAVSVGTAGFSLMPFTLRFSGRYGRLSKLFTDLEHFVSISNEQVSISGRLMRVESIDVEPSDGGYPALKASVRISTFLVPSTQGITAGATSQAPAATIPASTEPGSPSNPITPTAAATGAIE